MQQAKLIIIKDILQMDGIHLKTFIMSQSISITLSSDFELDKIGMTVGIGMSWGQDWFGFIKPTQGEAFPGIVALAEWIGGNQLANNLTSGFKNVNFDANAFDLALEKIELGFNWTTVSVNYLNIKSLLTIGALN